MAHKPTYEELEQRVKELEKAYLELKHVQEVFRESREKYRAVFETAKDAIFVSDETGRFVDGTPIPVEITGNFFKSKGQRMALAIARDISDRKQAEKIKRIYQLAVESAHDAIFFKDLESRYVIANAKTLEAFGLPKDKVIGKNDYETISNKEEAKKNIEDDQIVFKAGKPKQITKHMTDIDGKKYWFQAIKVPQFDEKGNIIGLVGIARDVTEQKQAEKEKKKLQAQLQQAQKLEAVGTLAGGIAHDFNNVLMGIQGYASLMLLNNGPDHPHFEHLKGIEDMVQTGAGLTKQLLGFAMGGKYEVKSTDLNELVENSSEMFGRTKKEINIHRKHQENIRPVEVDRGQRVCFHSGILSHVFPLPHSPSKRESGLIRPFSYFRGCLFGGWHSGCPPIRAPYFSRF